MQNKIQKHDVSTTFKNGRKITDFEIVDKEAAELSKMIQNRKERYFYDLSLKLNNPQISPKMYWSIIKSCYNAREISIILPLKWKYYYQL